MPRHNRNANPERHPLVARFKNNGRFFSRHYEVRTAEQVAARADGKGKILSVRKVHPGDIIGSLKSMNLQDVVGIKPREVRNVVLDETTIDSIVFPKSGESKRLKTKRQHLREQRSDLK